MQFPQIYFPIQTIDVYICRAEYMHYCGYYILYKVFTVIDKLPIQGPDILSSRTQS